MLQRRKKYINISKYIFSITREIQTQDKRYSLIEKKEILGYRRKTQL
jgi:hypothetical protein